MSQKKLPNSLRAGTVTWLASFAREWLDGWNLFWFAPRAPETLALIRICCGAMIAYIHCVWISLLPSFMGRSAWINGETIRQLHSQDWAWSWLFYIESPGWIFLHLAVAVLASICMTVGLLTRVAVPLTWWMTLMVCHRMTGALFGLDQVVMMLSMYLMWSRCGSVWSVDAWLARRHNFLRPSPAPCEANNIATRLIQLHLCVIYLFGGLSKMRGEMWWDGSAIWFSIVNYEYQSLDVTWLGNFPILIGLMTGATIFWETFYCCLIWPRLTRPLTLCMAFFVHGGICVALGMWTFGTMMIVANFVFLSPDRVRRIVDRVFDRKAPHT